MASTGDFFISRIGVSPSFNRPCIPSHVLLPACPPMASNASLQAPDLLPRLFQMFQESALQLLRRSRFDHFWQCFDDLLLGVVQIFQFFQEQNFKLCLFHMAPCALSSAVSFNREQRSAQNGKGHRSTSRQRSKERPCPIAL